ncbi:MAG: UDP-glucose/GDP-mannose dehydrogenase family protein [Candidatus Hydrogenedentota bacterium]|nr:MAG: UDP-glucose/GDP-mannose dehydrogenase family protein [Candidatus Hydrogenedentota bacterium]
MRVSVFGLGYVGCVTAACLAKQGHTVLGVDVVEEKVEAVNDGRWTIYEPGLEELGVTGTDRIRATTESRKAVEETDLSLICVGTPSRPDGGVETKYVESTMARMAEVLAEKPDHIVLVRSTSPPGTLEERLIPLLPRDPDPFSRVAFYPEFLREGTAVKDFFEPSLNVIGAAEVFPIEVVSRLLPEVKVPVKRIAIRSAEAIKYANNAFHALKIAFTNELALILKSRGVDAAEVMEVFCEDRKLNLSSYYMRPGFAFGGSCLPKELRALVSFSRAAGIDPMLFEAILKSNDEMILQMVKWILEREPGSVGYFGITFKPGTDDLRESPVLAGIERISSRRRSYSRKMLQYVFDHPAALARLTLGSADGVEPVGSEAELIEKADVIVLGPWRISEETERLLLESGKPVLNLKWHSVGARLRSSRQYHSLVEVPPE